MSIAKLIENYVKIKRGELIFNLMSEEDALALVERKLRERGIEPQIESFEIISRQAA